MFSAVVLLRHRAFFLQDIRHLTHYVGELVGPSVAVVKPAADQCSEQGTTTGYVTEQLLIWLLPSANSVSRAPTPHTAHRDQTVSGQRLARPLRCRGYASHQLRCSGSSRIAMSASSSLICSVKSPTTVRRKKMFFSMPFPTFPFLLVLKSSSGR